jgi:hypothetical protein
LPRQAIGAGKERAFVPQKLQLDIEERAQNASDIKTSK